MTRKTLLGILVALLVALHFFLHVGLGLERAARIVVLRDGDDVVAARGVPLEALARRDEPVVRAERVRLEVGDDEFLVARLEAP